MDNVEALRKLKFVYCFIKAAEDPVFQEVQKKCAEKWIEDKVLKKSIRGKTIGDYITSEHGIALVSDISVHKGPGSDLISGMVNDAIDKVLDKGILDSPASWKTAVEKDIINALSNYRINIIKDNDVVRRTNNINEANLNQERNSYK
jgi:hypothetical protein